MSTVLDRVPAREQGTRGAVETSGPERFLEKANVFFAKPLRFRSRLVILVGALLLIPTYLFPLYNMTFFSNQYTDGLNLSLYSHKLEGGHPVGRDDLREINTLNHYIGMRPLLESDFSEFEWIPLAIGVFFILALRTIVLGRMSNLVDTAVLFAYFGLFSFWGFYNRLYEYGHNLDPTAPIKVSPFTPPIFGTRELANFTVYSYPGPSSYLMVGSFLMLCAAILLSWRPARTR